MAKYPSVPKVPKSPRHWLSWFVVGLLCVAAQLPFRTQYRLGHRLGRIAQRVARRRANIVDLNVRLCFPDLTSDERQELVRKTFESLGVMAFESASLYFGREQEIIERGRIWGASELQDAVDEGNGVILIGVHLNSMEAAAAIMHANGFQFSCVTRKQRNPVADYIAETRRKKRFGIRNVYERKDLGLAARHLRRQRLNLWLAADQDMGRRSTVWVPFFGVEASTVTTPARILRAFRQNVPEVVLMSQYRDESEACVHVKFSRIRNLPSDDLCAAAELLNKRIEETIREHPEQYYWVHRRFKTLPDGGIRDYRKELQH